VLFGWNKASWWPTTLATLCRDSKKQDAYARVAEKVVVTWSTNYLQHLLVKIRTTIIKFSYDCSWSKGYRLRTVLCEPHTGCFPEWFTVAATVEERTQTSVTHVALLFAILLVVGIHQVRGLCTSHAFQIVYLHNFPSPGPRGVTLSNSMQHRLLRSRQDGRTRYLGSIKSDRWQPMRLVSRNDPLLTFSSAECYFKDVRVYLSRRAYLWQNLFQLSSSFSSCAV
jgi:hypothetical protein